MKVDRRTLMQAASRLVRLRCPACGLRSILRRPFQIHDSCPSCEVSFKREEGFFVGAIMANVVTTELVILAAYLLSIPFIAEHQQMVFTVLFALAVVFPLAYYHYSWSLWLTLDHLIESLPASRQVTWQLPPEK